MASQTMETPITLKLYMDNKSGVVAFAECGKDFVDFLFNLLTLPLGSVTQLLKGPEATDMLGCIETLYKSVQNLNDAYIQPDQDKSHLLQPKIPNPLTGNNPPLLLQSYTQLYSCNQPHGNYIVNVTDIRNKACPRCGNALQYPVAFVGAKTGSVASTGEGGYVRALATYVVTDDLVVTPLAAMSIVSIIALLKKFNVGDLNALDVKVVKVGMKEGLALLKASLQSTTVLNDVFVLKSEE